MSRFIDGFDAVVCDLDGVVISGRTSVPHAVEALEALEIPIVYATNNASRTPGEVVDMLRGHGVHTDERHVLTSSLAAARVLAAAVDPGSVVLAVGGPGVATSLRSVGLAARAPEDGGEDVVAIVQGYGAGVTAADLGAVAVAIRAGATWYVTNDDVTLPTDQGPLPGNGALVGAVRAAVDAEPVVIGKPQPPMYALAAELVSASTSRTLALGDRLETDIAGARATGLPAALVLTGVHGPADAAAAPPEQRPTHILGDLRELAEDYPDATTDGAWSCRGRARARWDGDLTVEGNGIDGVRAALDALWGAVDAGRITAQQARELITTG